MTVRALCDLGHDVRDIRCTEYKGSDDGVLWEIAQKEARLLVTTDMGFTQHREERHHGILIVRLKQQNRRKIHERVLKGMSQTKGWAGLLVVVQERCQRVWQVHYNG